MQSEKKFAANDQKHARTHELLTKIEIALDHWIAHGARVSMVRGGPSAKLLIHCGKPHKQKLESRQFARKID